MNTIFGLAAIFVSTICSAIVNSVEIAVVSANRISVHHLAESGSRSARALERLHLDQERFFSSIVLVQTTLVVTSGTIGGLTASAVSDKWYAVVGSTILTALATAEFGDLIPKVLASRASDSFALAVAIPTVGLARVLGPIVMAVGWLPRKLSQLIFGVDMDHRPSVSESELRMLIDISAESGKVDEDEAELLGRVFHFGDRQVHEVMIPRTEAVWLERDSKTSDFYRVFQETPHSRFPVYDDTPDNVVGILVIKDVLAAIAAGTINGKDGPIQPLIRPAFMVPETKPIVELFREMQVTGTQMAIAIDEFGGTAGIVTMELLLEEMFGPMHDEMGPEVSEITSIDENTSQVDGSLSIADAREELGIEIPEGPYDTIAGFVLSALGHIPEEGENVPLDEYRITVAEMKGPKIELLRVTKT